MSSPKSIDIWHLIGTNQNAAEFTIQYGKIKKIGSVISTNNKLRNIYWFISILVLIATIGFLQYVAWGKIFHPLSYNVFIGTLIGSVLVIYLLRPDTELLEHMRTFKRQLYMLNEHVLCRVSSDSYPERNLLETVTSVHIDIVERVLLRNTSETLPGIDKDLDDQFRSIYDTVAILCESGFIIDKNGYLEALWLEAQRRAAHYKNSTKHTGTTER